MDGVYDMNGNVSLDNVKQVNKRIIKEYDGDYPIMTLLTGLYPQDGGGYDMASVESSIRGLQEICNTLYKRYGVQDTILEFQTEINKLRYDFDVVDPSEVVCHSEEGDFVQ